MSEATDRKRGHLPTMRIQITDLDQFVEEANKLSIHTTDLERGIFITPITTHTTHATGISTSISRKVIASFSPDLGKSVVSYEVNLGSKAFMHTPKDEETFEEFASEQEAALTDLQEQLIEKCPNSRIYSGTLEI